PFDTELVARTVATMPVPVLTGVGHETDRSVADEVAHTACKTPTACAQVLVAQVRSFLDGLDDAAHRVSARARSRTAVAKRQLDHASLRVRTSVPSALTREAGRVDRHRARLHERGRRATRDAAASLHAREQSVARTAALQLERASLRIVAADATVRALDPHRVLERGS